MGQNVVQKICWSLLKLLRDILENDVLFADQNLTSPKVQGVISQGSHSPNLGPIWLFFSLAL